MAAALRALLRPSDTVLATLDAFSVPPQPDPNTGAPLPAPNAAALLVDVERVRRASEDRRNGRIIAVVVHDEAEDKEKDQGEGSVFVLRARSHGKHLEQSDILRVLPIVGGFSISTTQIRKTTLMDSFRSSTSSSALNPGFTAVTISQPDAPGGDPGITLCTQQAEGLKTLLSECKRLRELAEAPPLAAAPILTTFSWLAPYTARRAPLPSLFGIPEDIRIANTPLHERLSPAFAGQPGDDAGDVVKIRDEWIRVRAREEAGVGKSVLKIRIGTFNVNGNLPSQDLSTWLGTQPAQPYEMQSKATFIPALSPLITDLKREGGGIDDIMSPGSAAMSPGSTVMSPGSTTSPSEGAGRIFGFGTPTSLVGALSLLSPASSSAPVVPSPLSTSTQPPAIANATSPTSPVSSSTLSPSTPTAPLVADPPDMLVLGFQELDLSTEALLYANSTAREEAWMEAIYAALGQGRDPGKGGDTPTSPTSSSPSSTLPSSDGSSASKTSSKSKKKGYVKLASKQLVGMLIVVLVRAEIKRCFDEVKTTGAGTGIMGVMGNKGGTALRLRYTPPVPKHNVSSRTPSMISTSSASTAVSAASAASSATAVSAQTATSVAPKQPVKLRKPASTILTFVNTHLAAFDEMVEKRNADYTELVKKLRFELGTPVPAGGGPTPSGGGELLFGSDNETENEPPLTPTGTNSVLPAGTTCGIFESDVVFWMGDLNYRIDLPDSDVRAVLSAPDGEWAKGRTETLVRYDQLAAARRQGKAFMQFTEGRLTHLPTYRFNGGLGKDVLGYDIRRKPAWTDRVQWARNQTSAVVRVRQTSYMGHPYFMFSDHKPVSSEFLVESNVFDLPTAEKSADRLYRQLRGLEDAHEDHHEGHVALQVLDGNVDFGGIGFGFADGVSPAYSTRTGNGFAHRLVAQDREVGRKIVKREVVVKNVGKIPCAYRLVAVDGESVVHPEWLTVEPMTALLLPNETITLTLTAHITLETAIHLNENQNNKLSCTLILHTVMGKDHFVAVAAEYLPTCFGVPLARLTRLSGPARLGGALLPEERAINAPREVMRLINWMMGAGINMERVFIDDADEATVDQIRECLDTGADFPFTPSATDLATPVAFGETLRRLLDSMPEPLVPLSLQARCVLVTTKDEAFEMLDAFEPAAVNVWISVTAFLHYVVQSAGGEAENEARSLRVAGMFAPVLLRDDPDVPFEVVLGQDGQPIPISQIIGRREFLLMFMRA
uniref:DNase I-like protein n=1 Tax=Mycena chlorophos TaxID=658473 RepID=A0ABQ0M9R9_MYCCL|nr:DNase I-like protein [Mycena chlorophos]